MNKSRLNEIRKMIDEIKCVRKKLVNVESSFIKSEVYDCELSNGMVIRREKLIKGNGNGSACVILPITVDNKVVITIEPRTFSQSGVGISFPAGYVEKNESYEDAARRELLEETGYVCEKLIDLGGFYQDIGCSSAFNKSFIALGCVNTGIQHLDDSEFVNYFECSVSELDYLFNHDYILDVNAVLTLLKAKKYIK